MRKWLFLGLVLGAPVFAAEPDNPSAAPVPFGQKIGAGRLTYLMWDVYDATLYAPHGRYEPDAPFALSLRYLRDLKGRDIARRSVEEMRRQGISDEVKLAAWYNQMEAIFPDVHSGTVLTGIRTADSATVFEEDGREIGRIRDADFTMHFFDIWLSNKTSAPDLRLALLGATPPATGLSNHPPSHLRH